MGNKVLYQFQCVDSCPLGYYYAISNTVNG